MHHLRDTCSGFHVDVMDNHFVPNLAFSIDTVNAMRSETPLVLWTHLMVFNPLASLEKLALKEHDIVSVHYESARPEELKVIFKKLKDSNVVASCALKPDTPLSVLHELVEVIDHVLIMSVQAGFSGQQFLASTVSKLKELEEFQKRYKTSWGVGVDGGINLATIQEILSPCSK